MAALSVVVWIIFASPPFLSHCENLNWTKIFFFALAAVHSKKLFRFEVEVKGNYVNRNATENGIQTMK